MPWSRTSLFASVLMFVGGGLAADSSGYIYFADANGDFDTTLNSGGFPTNGDYGNAFLKVSTSGGLSVADYFEVDNEVAENVRLPWRLALRRSGKIPLRVRW